MTLTMLHTAQAHCATFDRLATRIAPGVALRHVVRPDWLTRAQTAINAVLEAEIADTVADAPGSVVCTCTTIGDTAELAGAIRVDRPMMRMAATRGGTIRLAYALRSTEKTSMDALQSALGDTGKTARIVPHFLGQHWPLFEAGDTPGFARAIAHDIRQAEALQPSDTIVLAQVSMAGAAPELADLSALVLDAPEHALRTGLTA